jgi:hypothetical protein
MFSYLALVDGAVNGHLDSITPMPLIMDPGSDQSIPKAQMDAD